VNNLTSTTSVDEKKTQELDFQRHMAWSVLCSMNWCERWLFVLLILVELLTITSFS